MILINMNSILLVVLLFKKLHAACHRDGILITICTQSSLAALSYDGATTAHSLFLYPVEDEDDIDDQNLPECNFTKERCDFLHEVLVIFWDEFISNDQILIEAVLEKFKTQWDNQLLCFCLCWRLCSGMPGALLI